MYILQNNQGYFLGRSNQWLDGRDPAQIFRTLHRDEAVNQLFETNSRDYNLRITLLECEPNAKGLPLIPEDKLPPPLPAEAIAPSIDEDMSLFSSTDVVAS